MPLEKLDMLTIYVSDQDAAVDFYRDKLGLETDVDHEIGPGMRFVRLFAPGRTLGIVLAPKEIGAMEGSNTEPAFSGWVFGAKDVQATYEELKARGVVFASEPEDRGGHLQVRFTDPDGNGFLLRVLED